MSDMTTDTAVIAAVGGYNVFYFVPGELKPSMSALQELMRGFAMQPVLCWKTQGDRVEPLTVITPPDGATRYLLCPNGRVLGLDDGTAFPNQDLWSSTLVAEWMKRRPQPTPVSIIPGRRSDRTCVTAI